MPKPNKGSNGADTLTSWFGVQQLDGKKGDDIIASRADAGEPTAQQDGTIYNPNRQFAASDDKLKGGQDADTFYFRLDLNARPEIIAKHQNADGTTDWHGVAGENGATHLHWVESLGDDRILDFVKGEDEIVIEGHTVNLEFDYANGDTIISLYSQQGAAGSHDEDRLGTITVEDVHLTAADVTVNAGVHYGVDEPMVL